MPAASCRAEGGGLRRCPGTDQWSAAAALEAAWHSADDPRGTLNLQQGGEATRVSQAHEFML